MNMRINKLLSETGLGSRREVETLIVEGRVTVNGVLAELTDVIEEDDVVTLDGEELPVCDLIREFAAEQKMQLVQKNSGRIGSQYIESEEEGGFRKKQGAFGAKHSSKAGRTDRSSFKPSAGKPAKFKKHWEEDDQESFTPAKHTSNKPRQWSGKNDRGFSPARGREERNFSSGGKKNRTNPSDRSFSHSGKKRKEFK